MVFILLNKHIRSFVSWGEEILFCSGVEGVALLGVITGSLVPRLGPITGPFTKPIFEADGTTGRLDAARFAACALLVDLEFELVGDFFVFTRSLTIYF